MDIYPNRRGQDDQLLRMLADSCFTLVSVADANGMSLGQLAEWCDQPHIRATIDALKRIATDRAELIAKDAASNSLSALTTLCTSLESEERSTLYGTDPRSRATRARNRETLRKCAKDIQALSRPTRGHSRGRIDITANTDAVRAPDRAPMWRRVPRHPSRPRRSLSGVGGTPTPVDPTRSRAR